MKTFETIAKTKKGDFKVVLTCAKNSSPVTGQSFWKISGSIEFDGTFFPVRIERLKQDRVYVTRELAEVFGVVYNDNLALSCDVTEAVSYVNFQQKNESDAITLQEKKAAYNSMIHNF